MADGPPAGYRWQALAIVALGTLTVHLDTTVNVALPAITAALQAPIPSLQWIIIGYVLTTASTLVGVGRLTDLIGRRAIWNWGLIALALALLLDSLAPSIEMLVAAGSSRRSARRWSTRPARRSSPRRSRAAERGRALGIMTMGGQVGHGGRAAVRRVAGGDVRLAGHLLGARADRPG